MSGGVKDLEDFYPYILPFANGCPEVTADQLMVKAAREFCERTRLWREKSVLEARTTATSVLACEDYAVIHEIDSVWFEGTRLEPEQYTSRDPENAPEDLVVAVIGPNELKLKAQTTGNFTITLFLKPKPDADVLPDFLFDNYLEAVSNGALGHIFAMQGRTWSNPGLAAYHKGEYQKIADKYFRGHTRGQARAPSKMRGQYC